MYLLCAVTSHIAETLLSDAAGTINMNSDYLSIFGSYLTVDWLIGISTRGYYDISMPKGREFTYHVID